MDNIEIATDANDAKYDGVTYTFQDVVTKIFSLSREHIQNLTNYKENQSWIYFKYPYYRILMKSFRKIGSDIELPYEVFPKSATLFKKYQGKKSTFTEQYNLKSVSCSMYLMLFLNIVTIWNQRLECFLFLTVVTRYFIMKILGSTALITPRFSVI